MWFLYENVILLMLPIGLGLKTKSLQKIGEFVLFRFWENYYFVRAKMKIFISARTFGLFWFKK